MGYGMNDRNKKMIDIIIKKADALCPDALVLIGVYGFPLLKYWPLYNITAFSINSIAAPAQLLAFDKDCVFAGSKEKGILFCRKSAWNI